MDKNLLKNYEVIKTDDGSESLFSKLYGEACHSTSGASSETLLHYIKGCRIEERLQDHSEISILEVGFGTGLGFKETLKALKDNQRVIFYSLEIDRNLIEYFFQSEKMSYREEEGIFYSTSVNFDLVIYCGEARESVKRINKKFHAIYQDAFSPKRNAILWTKEWFEDLKNLSLESCIMSTYSSSSSIRKSMIAAGWKVQKGDQFGPKRSSTRATLIGSSDQDILQRLERSPAITLTDENFENYTIKDQNEKDKNL